MRKILFIFCAILAYLLFSSRSCNSPEQDDDLVTAEESLRLTKDSIKAEFEVDELNKKALQAFETKAKEKLTDLYDYLNLYSDKNLDDNLKISVNQTISKLFTSDSVLVKTATSAKPVDKSLILNQFLNSVFLPSYDSIVFKVDSVEVIKPLYRNDELSYGGILKFSQKTVIYTSSANPQSIVNNRKAEFFVVKVNTTFGADTVKIWRVLLGNIE